MSPPLFLHIKKHEKRDGGTEDDSRTYDPQDSTRSFSSLHIHPGASNPAANTSSTSVGNTASDPVPFAVSISASQLDAILTTRSNALFLTVVGGCSFNPMYASTTSFLIFEKQKFCRVISMNGGKLKLVLRTSIGSSEYSPADECVGSV